MTALPPRVPSVHEPHPHRWTPDEFRIMGEVGLFGNERVELIDGEIVDMSPINWPHVVAVNKLHAALAILTSDRFWLNMQHPAALADGLPQPDAAVYPGRMADYSDHPTNPVLLVEVADSSLRFDLTRKPPFYARAAVPEYWVIDLVDRLLHVFRSPDAETSTYKSQQKLNPSDRVAPLFAPTASILVADVLP